MIGANIKSLRKKHNLSQEELGSKLGVTTGAISSWEKGRTEPNIEYLYKIANAFGIDFNELLNGSPTIAKNELDQVLTLKADEIEIIKHYRHLSPSLKQAIKLIVGVEE